MKKSRPLYATLAIAALVLLGLGGLAGGIGFILDPTGKSMGFPPEFIADVPLFNSFLIPGILLVLLFGLLPLFTAGGLLRFRPVEKTSGRMALAWKLGLLCGILLIIWIAAQVLLIGFQSFLQPLFGLWGILINWLLTSAPVRVYYQAG